VIGFGRPPTQLFGIRLGVLDRQARDDAIEAAALPPVQPRREIGMNKTNSLIPIRKANSVAQPLEGHSIVGRAGQTDDFLYGPAAVMPEGLREFAAAASQVQPALSRTRRQPGAGVGQQSLIRRQFLLAPKGSGAGGIRPIIKS